jgi:uncharacterized protein (TIGR00369 family)
MSQGGDRNAQLQATFAAIPYAQFLGVRLDLAGDELTAVLPFSPHLVGNPVIRALHGGVLGAFMELTAIAQLRLALDPARQPRVINVSVEYLRSARPQDTFARADLRRVGRRIANVHVEAWQGERASPVAALRGHFLLGQGEEAAG